MRRTPGRILAPTLLAVLIAAALGCSSPQRVNAAVTVRAGSAAPARGLLVLPPGYRVVRVGGETYYRHRNVYYRLRHGRYVVVPRPVAVRVIHPDGSTDR